MKSFLLVACVVVGALAVHGQTQQVEKDFEISKTKYTFEHFAEGEDATSGYDYLFYKLGDKIVMVRSIWSASYSKQLRVEDFYFNGDDPILFRKSTAPAKLLRSLKRGRDALLAPKEEFHFAGGKLTKWTVEGKLKPADDAAWARTEKEVLDQAKAQREYYKWLKEGNF